MRILSVRFRSTIAFTDLEQPWTDGASHIAAVPGLLSKTWGQEGQHFAGIYMFRDQASLDGYLTGPIIASVKAEPGFADLRVEQYDVLEELSAITRGVPAIAAGA